MTVENRAETVYRGPPPEVFSGEGLVHARATPGHIDEPVGVRNRHG